MKQREKEKGTERKKEKERERKRKREIKEFYRVSKPELKMSKKIRLIMAVQWILPLEVVNAARKAWDSGWEQIY